MFAIAWVLWGCADPPGPVDSGPPPAPGTAYAVQMHLHGPLSEGDTTYAFQGAEAARFDVDVLWWTDHDHMYDRSAWIEAPRWADGGPLVTDAPPPQVKTSWWEVLPGDLTADVWVDPTAYEGAPALVFDATAARKATLGLAGCAAAPEVAAVAWHAQGDQGYNELARALLADVTLRLALRPDVGWESGVDRVRVKLPMSMVEDGVPRVLWLAEADDTFPVGPLDVVVPVELDPGVWTTWELNLSDYAREHLPEGVDLAMQGLELHLEPAGDASVALAGVQIEDGLCCDALRDAQQDLFDTISDGPVKHLIGLELSYESTRHLTSFGAPVFVPYGEQTLHQPIKLVQWAHEQGAKVAVTHVFGPTADVIDPSLDRDATVAETCDQLDADNVYGADYLEVGYPVRALDLTAHLDVWDCLMARGHLQPGIGTSDNHFTRRWETSPNRFVTWIASASATEDALLDALSAGRAFFGDPVLTRNAWLDLTSDVAVMGQIATGLPADPVRIEAQVNGALTPARLRWMVDGELADAGVDAITVTPGAWTVVRAELWTDDGAPLLFSNPIILSTEDLDIPEERRAR